MALALAKELAEPGRTRKTKLTGLTGLGIKPPRRNEEGLGRRQVEIAPSRCPRCEGRVIQPLCRQCDEPTRGYVVCQTCGAGDNLDRRCYCQLCGWDSYLVRG
jgi:DNA polymerase II large subunit DP2